MKKTVGGWILMALGCTARWRGFNLLDLVSWEKGRMSAYREEDFRLLHEWGFNFVRLPTDYRWFADAAGLKAIDDALAFGRKYAIHVQLCSHRLPGYCSGGRLAGEKDLFTDEEPLRDACALWRMFAARYRGVPNDALSFNLFNEPLYMEEAAYARVAQDATGCGAGAHGRPVAAVAGNELRLGALGAVRRLRRDGFGA